MLAMLAHHLRKLQHWQTNGNRKSKVILTKRICSDLWDTKLNGLKKIAMQLVCCRMPSACPRRLLVCHRRQLICCKMPLDCQRMWMAYILEDGHWVGSLEKLSCGTSIQWNIWSKEGSLSSATIVIVIVSCRACWKCHLELQSMNLLMYIHTVSGLKLTIHGRLLSCCQSVYWT